MVSVPPEQAHITRVPSSSELRQLSVSELTETLEEVETAIRRYSEELIQALALRDELDYEKEVLPPEFFT